MRKTSSNMIKETRRSMVKSTPKGVNFNKEFIVKYDKNYGVDRILYGTMEVTTQSLKYVQEGDKKVQKIVEDVIFKGKKVCTSNPKMEIFVVKKRLENELKGKNPGTIYIYDCNDSGKASIPDYIK